MWLDWGKPTSSLMRGLFYAIQLLDGFATTQDNVDGFLPQLFSAGGFQQMRQQTEFATIFGTLTLYQAYKPR